ncbi:MAG: hypothetical protein HY314_09010 [Acidobacteria bacterium]|nr:hypothetical protein [Acidobacteriota bacterium]
MKKVSLLIAVMLAVVSAGLGADFVQRISLQSTNLGKAMGAGGEAAIGERNGVQFFGVQVFADVEDGTVFRVIVNNGQRDFTAGKIIMEAGQGKLVLRSTFVPGTLEPQPQGIFPVTEIRSVRVADQGEDILTGEFTHSLSGEKFLLGSEWLDVIGSDDGDDDRALLSVAPANDNCASATAVTFSSRGGVFMECMSTAGATVEAGEVSPPCAPDGASVWYQVTAGKKGLLDLGTFGAVGSTSTNYDTTIAAYNTTTCVPTNANLITCNNDFDPPGPPIELRSRILIPVTAGQVVLVRVAGYQGATGTACVRFVNF